MMKIMIELYGYKVIEAADGYDAVEKAREHQPDLILMDLSMPVLNGVDATRLLRSETEFSSIPILAVTAYRDMSDAAIASGCDEVIHKPVEFTHLKKVLEQKLSEN